MALPMVGKLINAIFTVLKESTVLLSKYGISYTFTHQYITVSVFTFSCVTRNLVLRLAAKHNRATDFTHSMKTQDKVVIMRFIHLLPIHWVNK